MSLACAPCKARLHVPCSLVGVPCVCALRLGLGKAWQGGTAGASERARRWAGSWPLLLALVGWAVRAAGALGKRVRASGAAGRPRFPLRAGNVLARPGCFRKAPSGGGGDDAGGRCAAGGRGWRDPAGGGVSCRVSEGARRLPGGRRSRGCWRLLGRGVCGSAHEAEETPVGGA